MHVESQAKKIKKHALSSTIVRRTVFRDACLIMFVALFLFGANNIYTGYVYLGFIDVALALGMLVNAWRLQRMDSDQASGGMLILLFGPGAILVAVYSNKYGVYWSYIVVAVSFLVVDRRSALVFDLVFIMLMIALTAFITEPEFSARVGVTLSLLAAISFIFSTHIDEKNRQLLSYSEELEKADEAKSEFIANMSHEMRTPLTTIMGYAENMLSCSDLDPVSRGQLATMLSNAKSLSFMIEDVLDLTRMENKVVDNGQAAVDIMHTESFDLVLMDLQMPVLSGIDATAAIRQLNSYIPIVALSSDVLLYDKDAEQLAGFNHLLPKPVEMRKLQKTFEKLLPAQEKFA
jgi:CheY-like chemotaxis protein